MFTSKWELRQVYKVFPCPWPKSHLEVNKICVPEYFCHPLLIGGRQRGSSHPPWCCSPCCFSWASGPSSSLVWARWRTRRAETQRCVPRWERIGSCSCWRRRCARSASRTRTAPGTCASCRMTCKWKVILSRYYAATRCQKCSFSYLNTEWQRWFAKSCYWREIMSCVLDNFTYNFKSTKALILLQTTLYNWSPLKQLKSQNFRKLCTILKNPNHVGKTDGKPLERFSNHLTTTWSRCPSSCWWRGRSRWACSGATWSSGAPRRAPGTPACWQDRFSDGDTYFKIVYSARGQDGPQEMERN